MNLSILNVNYKIVTMTSLEMADLAEKRHDSVKRTIDMLAGRDAISHPQIVAGQKSANGVTEQVYLVGKRDSYVVMAQLSPEFTARLVDRWQELEEEKAGSVLDSEESKLLLIQELATKQITLIRENKLIAIERDHAIATKAQIGSKREATAMATASAAKKESASLKARLGFNEQHATVKAVQAATGKPYAWLPLRKWCEALNQQPKNVTDPLYGAVKAWPSGAWAAVYSVDLVDLFGEASA